MRSSDEPATVADIERDLVDSRAADLLRARRRRMRAIVVGLAALGALVASALAPSFGDDDAARPTPAPPAPARTAP